MTGFDPARNVRIQHKLKTLRAKLALANRRIADLEQQLAASEAECNRWWGRCQKHKADAEFNRRPARDREYCGKCGKPRDRECPDCGATYPE